jgi:hypothetical protein
MTLMDNTARDRFPRLAPVLLVAALIGIAVARHGILAGDSDLAYRFLTTLTSTALAAYVAWRFHGILAAAAVLMLLRLAEPDSPIAAAFHERQSDAVFLATLAIGIAVGSRQGRAGNVPWLLIAIVSAGVALFGWYGIESPLPEDAIVRDRMRHVTLALAFSSVVVGLLTRRSAWLDRLKLAAITIGIPAAGLVAFRIVHSEWPRLLEGGNWPAVSSEWKNAIATGEWESGAWVWTLPWVVVPLILIGFWRTIARGRNEIKNGRPPLPWLLTIASLGAMVALGARPIASGSLALAAVGALLSVFGVADLVQALVERIELKPPEPSGLARVK